MSLLERLFTFVQQQRESIHARNGSWYLLRRGAFEVLPNERRKRLVAFVGIELDLSAFVLESA